MNGMRGLAYWLFNFQQVSGCGWHGHLRLIASSSLVMDSSQKYSDTHIHRTLWPSSNISPDRRKQYWWVLRIRYFPSLFFKDKYVLMIYNHSFPSDDCFLEFLPIGDTAPPGTVLHPMCNILCFLSKRRSQNINGDNFSCFRPNLLLRFINPECPFLPIYFMTSFICEYKFHVFFFKFCRSCISVQFILNNQLAAHFFFIYVYINSLHVSSIQVLIIRRLICINTISGICHLHRVTYTRYRIDTNESPYDEHLNARNM